GELAHRPEPSPVAAGVDTPLIRVLAGQLLGDPGEVLLRVERLDRDARDGRGLDPVGALLGGVVRLLPARLAAVLRSCLHCWPGTSLAPSSFRIDSAAP